MKKINILSFLITSLFITFININGFSATFSSNTVNPTIEEIEMHVSLEPQEWIYKDLITVTSDNPAVTITPYKTSYDAHNQYDPTYKKTKKVFDQNVTFSFTAIKNDSYQPSAFAHIALVSNKTGPQETIIELFPTKITPEIEPPPSSDHTSEVQTIDEEKNVSTHSYEEPFSISTYISGLIKSVQSPFIRILLVFLLGVLLSLTPCIYPMIPITIGILQTQGSKSLLFNFLLSLFYTLGMATTFACFGLLAGCVGPLCGQLLMKPFFIIGLVTILTYLALSMIGLYDLHVPNIIKIGPSRIKGGPLLSSFMFGAASGTIASPCVSPGLALLLSIVATLGNKIMGFLLLFSFGIGISMPLLIVGVCSSSLQVLPKAGLWMIEVKRLFGFLIFAICFYYINFIVPHTILLWFVALFVLAIGIFYLYHSQQIKTGFLSTCMSAFGSLLAIISFLLFFQAYKSVVLPQKDSYDVHHHLWHTDYQSALEQARDSGKKLFIDFWARFCPVCLAINNTTFTKPAVIEVLQEYILLKVDGTNAYNSPYKELKEKFSITGFPTFLIVNPATEQIETALGAELYDMPIEQLIDKLKSFNQ